MAKKTNPTAVGVFLIGAVVLIVAGVLIFGSGKLLTETETYVTYFEGSVKGLNVGSPVVFRGVKIGSVIDIQLQHDPNQMLFRIPVVIEIVGDKFHLIGTGAPPPDEQHLAALIETGMRAQLQLQSLVTGQLMVEIDIHPDTPVHLVGGPTDKYPELPTVPTAFQKLSKTLEEIPLEEIAHRVAGALEGIDRMVNSPEAQAGTRALNEALQETALMMKKLNEKIDPLAASIEATLADTRKLLSNTDQRVGSLSSGLGQVVGDTRKLVENTDGRVGDLTSSIDQTLRDARGVVQNVDDWVEPLLADVGGTSAAARAALAQAESALASLEDTTGESSQLRFEFTNALREISATARSLRALTDYLQQNPDALLRGKGGQGGR